MKNIFKLITLAFLGFLISLILRPHTAFAKSESIVINEIYYNVATEMGDDPAAEWVELYNSGDDEINIRNWTLADNSGNDKILSTTDLTIAAKSFVLISRSNTIWAKWGINPLTSSEITFIELTGTNIYNLAKGGDRLLLKNDSGEAVDEVSFGTDETYYDIAAAEEGSSLDRKNLGIDNDLGSDFTNRPSPTPGEEFIPLIYSDEIVLNEIAPEPSEGVGFEFIELYNSSDLVLDISGWQLADMKGATKTFTIPASTIIPAKSYLVFYRTETGISLNDDGDGVFLIDPNGDYRDEISYDSAIRGESFSKFGSSWQWSEKQTPGSENRLVQSVVSREEETGGGILGSINEAKQYQNGDEVALVGIVTTLPGEISSQYFFIQDETGGIEVYSYYKTFPNLNRGDKIKVTGQLSDYYGTRRIKINSISDIEIISPNAMPPPIVAKIPEIGEQYESQYIKTKGKISYTSGSVFRMTEGSREIQVEIKSGTGIKKPKMRKGDLFEVAGILIQYKNGYKLLPFLQDDVKIIQSNSGSLPKSGLDQMIYLIITALIYSLWNLFQTVRSKLKNLPQNLSPD
ncbi:MAG: lamin tail domain-containing protein [Patescibacteria group bacterium]